MGRAIGLARLINGVGAVDMQRKVGVVRVQAAVGTPVLSRAVGFSRSVAATGAASLARTVGRTFVGAASATVSLVRRVLLAPAQFAAHATVEFLSGRVFFPLFTMTATGTVSLGRKIGISLASVATTFVTFVFDSVQGMRKKLTGTARVGSNPSTATRSDSSMGSVASRRRVDDSHSASRND
jgi:hypothetical protein